MKEKIIALLKDIREDIDFSQSVSLIDDGLLSSLEIIKIIEALNDELGISIPVQEIKPENFNSVEAITALTERLANENK